MYDLLIVEDEKRIRTGIVKHIPWSNIGFNVVASVESGQEAMQWIETKTPHVIITDIRMRNMDGLELMKAVRKLGLDIKFVVLSGYSNFEFARIAMSYGASAYLLKPTKEYEIKEVFQKLKTELDSHASHANQSNEWINLKLDRKISNDEIVTLEKVIKCINAQYEQKITLNKIADMVHMSPAHFSRYFKHHVGRTFIEYLTDVRLNKSKEYLINTTYKVFEIALMVGYDDYRHFCKIFRSREGMSPRDYRNWQNKEKG